MYASNIQLWMNSNYTIQGRSLDLEPNRQKPANNWRKESSIFTQVSLTKKRLIFFLKSPRIVCTVQYLKCYYYVCVTYEHSKTA